MCMIVHALHIRGNTTNPSNSTLPRDHLTVVGTNISYNGEIWTVFEDLNRADGGLFFVSSSGQTRNLTRYLEQSFDPPPGTGSVPFFLGLNQSEVNLALPDLLAEVLLMNGEPIEAHVRDAVPQVVFETYQSFVGNIQANDTMFVDGFGSTNNIAPLSTIDIPDGFTFDFSYDGLVS